MKGNQPTEKIFFIPVSEEEFYKRIGEIVHAAMYKSGLVETDKRNSKWLTHQEASAYLRKTPAALYKLTSTKEVRYVKQGKANAYLIEDLDKFMEKGLVRTADDLVKDVQLLPKKRNFITKQ